MSPVFRSVRATMLAFTSNCFSSHLRKAGALVALLAAVLCVAWNTASAQTKPATATTLTVTSRGSAVTTVASGSVVTLTATVQMGGTAVTTGQVNFCDASAKYCTDIHLLGTSQLTSAGTASMKFRPGIGSHSYKAVFLGTTSNAASYSATAALTVTGLYATTTAIAQSGAAGNYTLTATVAGVANAPTAVAPSGAVSFIDTSNSNAVLATTALGAGTAGLSLLNVSTPALKQEANVVAVADFNGDGIPDLVVSDSNSGQVLLAILLGNGDGTFTATASSPTVGLYPDSIVVGDFNGDGIADLAVSSVDDNKVTILLGKGDGTFTTAPTLNTGTAPQSLAMGDFNGDGIPDLVVVNANSALIFLGSGDGTFKSVSASPALPYRPITVAVGDFNGNGNADLAVTNGEKDTVTILLGNGDGTFTAAAASPATGGSPDGLAVADFNGDGILDLAVTNYDGYSGNAVAILLGNGDGTFKAATTYSAPGMNFHSVVVSDVNADGIADLAVGEFWHGTLAILLGNGDGAFAAGISKNAISQLGSGYLAAADFNGDGIPDLALPSQDGTVPILLTQPNLTVTATANGISPAGPGTHAVKASYPGDKNYGVSASATTALTAAVAAPVISAASGSYTSLQTISISDTTPGATIYYEGTGTLQTNGYVMYTGPIPVYGNGSAAIYAYAAETGYQQSAWVNASYSLKFPMAATPVISLASGSYSGTQTVAIADATPGSSIFYTTNGSTPSASSTLYTGPITVSSSETVAAVAMAGGYGTSNVASALYLIASTSSSFIYTVAGNDRWGYAGDGGPATAAMLNSPAATAVDSAGNVYIADSRNNAVRKIAAGTAIISTVAGTGAGGYSGDQGAATSAELSSPQSVAVDTSGNLYIADTKNNLVRMVAAGTGIITTYAGNSSATATGDNGPATSALLVAPFALALDGAGNLYIASACQIRKVTASTAVISTVAGSSSCGFAGDSGLAINARLNESFGLTIDNAGNLFIADTYNSVVRKVTASTGIITTVAGIANSSGYNGDGIAATSAKLYFPVGVAVDNAGNLYIADTDNMLIRRVTANTGLISTIAGSPSSCISLSGDGGPAAAAAICWPQGISMDSAGNLYIAEGGTSRIRKVTASMPAPTTATAAPVFAVGSGTYESAQTVSVTDATPGAAIYLTLDGTTPTTSGQSYHGAIHVTGSVTLKAVAVAPGYVPSAVATAAYTITTPPAAIISTVAGSGVYGAAGSGGPALSAQLGAAKSVALDSSGNLYIADQPNSVVWMVSASTGTISVVAGTLGSQGNSGNGGLASAALLGWPVAVALDSANNLYIVDELNNVVRKVAAGSQMISSVAGNGYYSSTLGDGGLATSANLSSPLGLAVDSAANLYIADTENNRIRKVTAATGIITTVAGGSTTGLLGDGGLATAATLANPGGVAVDGQGNLYIADTSHGRVRRVDAGSGLISTLAGNGDPGSSGDEGLATAVEVFPAGVALDGTGNLYIADVQAVVRKIPVTGGVITTVAGSGYSGWSGDGGSATVAEIAGQPGIAFDDAGSLYIADNGNYRVRKVTFPGPAATPVFSVAAGTYTKIQTVTITDAAQGATIYYTTDGTRPTTASAVYSGPITVSATETLEAIAVGAGYTESAVATAAYTISLPVTPSITWPTPAAITYGTALSSTQLNATASVPGTFAYNPAAGTTPAVGSDTLSVTFTPTDATDYTTATASVTLVVNPIPSNPVPVLSSMSPAFTSAGGAAFTLTITGTGFVPGSTAYWGTTALTTQFVSATQLTAQITTADIGAAGATPVTVQTPTPGGGASNPMQFEVDSAGSTSIAPTFTTVTATVAAGSTASYPVTLPATVTSASVACLNLPAGATCSYSSTTNALTITTVSTTPAGMYQVTVAFTETVSGAATAGILLPILLLPLVLLKRNLTARGGCLSTWFGLALLTATAFAIGCGGGGSSSTTPPPVNPTHQITSSKSVTLIIH